jgi:3-isopropylmalate/(R)-2-methylmalate dehydratase large subunit
MEFGGPALASISMDERATLTNMATECSAKSGICEGDEKTIEWIMAQRPDADADALRARIVQADEGAEYAGGVHTIDLTTIQPMAATPGDPTYGKPITELESVVIDIAYGGSCTAGKHEDIDFYAKVLSEARDAGQGIAPGVTLFIQFGSKSVQEYARSEGYLDLFGELGVRVILPGCGACIGCGPGVSEESSQVTVSAINRNFQGRSGPGQLYLASPLTVAASAIAGRITSYQPGMFPVSIPQHA